MRLKTIFKVALIIFGFYLFVDGAGSIHYYLSQPFYPDHFFRCIRCGVGLAIAYVGWRI